MTKGIKKFSFEVVIKPEKGLKTELIKKVEGKFDSPKKPNNN